ncbi:MAG: hypothetical protein Q7J30_02495 [Candidatus Azambacteria bacterium]|nr:hypothetical protein [Candidatus Azambacteria bacterium]
MEDFLKPIKVKIFYDEGVKKITGKDSEEAMVSEGLKFVNMLGFIFASYPEIEKTYSPGKLGLLLNNRAPKDFDVLQDGDEIILKIIVC